MTSERELRRALQRRVPEIVVDNPRLARQIRRFKRLSPRVVLATIAALAASAAALPVLGPVAIGGGVLAVTITGAELAVIVAIVGVVGIGLVTVLYGDYEVVEVVIAYSEMRVTIRRKQPA